MPCIVWQANVNLVNKICILYAFLSFILEIWYTVLPWVMFYESFDGNQL